MLNKSKIIFSFIIITSCNKQLNEVGKDAMDPHPFVWISSVENQKNIPGIKDIYINIEDFPKVWKIYLSIVNKPAISDQNRILLDTTSKIDQDEYHISWDTKLYPNGEYELYSEIIDSLNNRIFANQFLNINNYKILNIKNNLESSIEYQISGKVGIIFSNSFGLIEVENFFNDLNLTTYSRNMPCGISAMNKFTIKPDSSNNPIIINPDSTVFFLKIQNNQNSYIDSIAVKNNLLYERCNNISIPNDNQVYSIGYFSLDGVNETKIIASYGNRVDTVDVNFYNESIKIDTLIIH